MSKHEPIRASCMLSFTMSLLCVLFTCVTENGPRLSVVSDQSKVVSRRGGNATLPCQIQRDQSLAPNRKMRIKWTKLTSDYLKEVSVTDFNYSCCAALIHNSLNIEYFIN